MVARGGGGSSKLVVVSSTLFAKSHSRTVVRECCEGDDAGQWGNGKFDPLPPPNPALGTFASYLVHRWRADPSCI